MELSYSYNTTEGWYKPDGQSQTVIMRRTSLGTASLSTTSPATSQPHSRTGTHDSDRTGSAGRENRDPNTRNLNLKPVSHAHQSQPQSQPKTRVNPDVSKVTTPLQRAERIGTEMGRGERMGTVPVPSPPSSSAYSYGSGPSSAGGSMERALLPKRHAAHASASKRPHRAGTGAGGKGKGTRTATGAGTGGKGPSPSRVPGTALYVNELGPNGSWYIPKKPKDKSASSVAAGVVEPGLMKTFLNAFKKKNKVAGSNTFPTSPHGA
ncbi:hypothetical protein CVT25_013467 [Psilocybe cyanescens]|uniref:Uncharacterized protein n=1 Tax=Psilocybe cyanescens TaxID=93625 RepID=A0A409WTR2_PSICY|nr:hypothetical protein CVT25_013467 [Psilocybe cyanescens]